MKTTHINKKIVILFITTILFWFSLYAYVPILPLYARSLGASYKLLGLIIGIYGLSQILFRIPLGIISDRLNKRKIFILTGIILAGLGSFGMWHSDSPEILLVHRFITGIAAAVYVIITVLFSSYYDDTETSKAMGYVFAAASIGIVLGTFSCGIIATVYNQRTVFLIAALSAFAGIICSCGIVEKKFKREPIRIRDLITVVRNRNLLVASSLAIMSQFIAFSSLFGFTPIAARAIGATDYQIGFLLTISTLPFILAAPLSGTLLVKKIGERKLIAIGFIITAISNSLIPCIKTVPVLYISQLTAGFGQGLLLPLIFSLSIRHVESSKRATAMGFFQALYGIGIMLGPAITGLIADTIGLRYGFFFIGIIGVIGSLIALNFVRDTLQPAPPPS